MGYEICACPPKPSRGRLRAGCGEQVRLELVGFYERDTLGNVDNVIADALKVLCRKHYVKQEQSALRLVG